MKARKNYRVQKTCQSCQHCFVTPLCGGSGRWNYFCMAGYRKRKPLFLRVYLRITDEYRSFTRIRREWDRFAHNNRVDPNGVCDLHKEKKS